MRACIAALVFAGVLGGCVAGAGVGYNASYVGPAPVYVGPTATVSVDAYGPDLVEVSPGVQVIADYDEPVFYTDNYYWRYHSGTWYRSNVYTGGWTVYHDVPYSVRRIDRPYSYRHYRPRGYVPRARRDRRHGPTVRDHRQPHRAPVVRDHRQPYRPAAAPVVRDHRQPYRPAAAPVVRDHRQPYRPAPAPVTRDHRQPYRPAPAPVTRDHRQPSRPAAAPVTRDHRQPARTQPTTRDRRSRPVTRDHR